jgi:Zn-dependent protease with chaperone function
MENPVVTVSPAFRQQVPKVVGSIVLFMIVYLLLVAAAVGLAGLCFFAGIALIFSLSHILIIIVGLGLIALGVSVLIFLVKFVFAVSKEDNIKWVVVTEQEQPRLFAFIRQVTEETGTPFPKKIFLAPEVNAAVFYNSHFWSMFLPIKKNLMIGLGLVNSVNVSEFKAVMAHEFGHFSQRSMKLGSFTYNVNKVIYNMLYENTGYTKFLQGWGRIHGILAFFARVTFWIAEGIQWVLRKMYAVINKSYMGLSREMEFHADAVAASVAGGNNVVSGLSRIEVADSCYRTALNEAEARARHHRVSRNLFANQLTVFRSFGDDNQIPLEQGIPAVSYAFVSGFSRSRINFRNQWASHPTLDERKRSLDALGTGKPADTTSAWTVFNEVEALQERMTANLYREAVFKEKTELYGAVDFEREYLEEKRRYALPVEYRGFYNGRFIEIEGWNLDALVLEPAPPGTFSELFTDAAGQIQQAIVSINKDIELALTIKQKQIDVKSFDFDGVKYDVEDGEMIAEQLKKEVAELKKRQLELDKQAFVFFVHAAGNEREPVIANYRQFQAVKRRYDAYVKVVNAVLEKIRSFYSGSIGLDAVERILRELKMDEERDLKAEYRALLTNSGFGGTELREKMQHFVDSDYRYFVNKQYMNNELDDLRNTAIAVAREFNEYQFDLYKKMLVEQLAFTTPPARG